VGDLTSASKSRLAWIDVAKGFCITFIVFGHVVHSNMFAAVGGSTPWDELVRAFSPLRIPLFLFVSGYLASSSMDRPLSASFGKTGGLYLIYVVWELAFVSTRALTNSVLGGLPWDASHWMIHTSIAMVLPGTLWYIWALPAYYFASWVIRRVLGDRAAYAVWPMLALSALTPFVAGHADGWEHFGETSLGPVVANITWFHFGIYGRSTWSTLLKRANGSTFLHALLIYASLYLAARLSNVDTYAQFALAPFALLMATQFLGWGNLDRSGARLLSKLGKQTLPIYVMHLFGLSVLTVVANSAAITSVAVMAPIAYLILTPFIATTLLVGGCRVAGQLILGSPLKPLLEPMRWPVRRLTPVTVAGRE